jgi:hypothetical protein
VNARYCGSSLKGVSSLGGGCCLKTHYVHGDAYAKLQVLFHTSDEWGDRVRPRANTQGGQFLAQGSTMA